MSSTTLGVLSALPEELAHLADESGGRTEIAGIAFRQGVIAGRPAVFVECGVGKVNAGIATAYLLERFGCAGLMFCGVAGGLDPALGVGDVVVGTSNLQHDYGAEQEDGFLAFQPGVAPLPGVERRPGYRLAPPLVERLRAAAGGLALEPLPESVGVGARRPTLHFGGIVTGDSFINRDATRERLHREFGAQAVEMEGGAVAQVAHRLGDVPFVNVRCLSDLAGATSHLDFRAFLPIAARTASLVAHRLAPHI
ncbi:MAG: 5'-methylthioadenosine/adenosylhomocysteine nucleosidase [Alphaproteobacteria bacterium]|nr:5'-methylthioadenosine/adenosylhomocysteine nucleosidase [Alphaproteobacteria bacterium]